MTVNEMEFNHQLQTNLYNNKVGVEDINNIVELIKNGKRLKFTPNHKAKMDIRTSVYMRLMSCFCRGRDQQQQLQKLHKAERKLANELDILKIVKALRRSQSLNHSTPGQKALHSLQARYLINKQNQDI